MATVTTRIFVLFCSFVLVAITPGVTYAEYYQVYSGYDWNDQCNNCPPAHHRSHHKSKKINYKKHFTHRHSGLYVTYPVYKVPCCNDIWSTRFCECCPGHIRNQWGDYVVFSARPTDDDHTYNEPVSTYNPDRATTDDGYPDMEINY